MPGVEGLEFKTGQALHVLEDGPGVLEAYAAIFNNEDRDGDVIVKGAFASSIAQFKESGFLCDQHDWHAELGTVQDAWEDDIGLFVKCLFFDTPDAQLVRQKIAAKVARGRAQQMSIGFRTLEFERTKKGRRITDTELFEVSPVSVAANPQTHVTAIKSIASDPDIEVRRAAMRRATIDRLAAQARERNLLCLLK